MQRTVRALLCAAGCCLAVTVTASTDPLVAARAVVERYVAETGGRAALEADTLVHARGRITDAALGGTFEEWRRGTDHVLRNERLGMLRTRMGYDGTRGWTTDFTSRKVGPLEGKDLEALRAEAWFASEQWARDTTTRVTLGPSSFLSGRSLRAIEVTPPVGPRQTLWFDDKTGLLARVTHRRDQYDWNEDLSGWKTLAGRKRSTVATVGMKEFASSFHKVEIDSVWAEGPPGADAFSPPATTAAPVTWQGARSKIELPFHYRRGHVWVSLSVNGAPPAEFILDTGAFNTCLDRSYARSLGLSAEGEHVAEGVGGYDTFGFTQLRSLRWAVSSTRAVVLPDLRAGVIELQEGMSSVEWGRTAGLIGYDVLSRFTLDLDFDRQVLTLYDPATYVHTGPGTPIPMTLRGNVPTVEAKLNGRCKGTYIVDVGNASVLSVGADQVLNCGLLNTRHKEVQHWVGGIGGAFVENVCRLDSLELGPFRFMEPVAGLTTHHQGGAGSKEIQGNIGTTVLERFRCTFDYAHGTLWLEPGARYAQREAFTRSGLWFTRWAGVVVVVGVVRHSPAEDAGLKVRDVLRAINGRAIESWTPEQLDALLQDGNAGTVVKLTYERELHEETVELTLADVL
jgi:hypothetical protein